MFDGDQVAVPWNAAYVSSFCNLSTAILMMMRIMLIMMTMIAIAVKIDYDYQEMIHHPQFIVDTSRH